MKPTLLFLPLFLFLFWSCDKEDPAPVQVAHLSAIVIPGSSSVQEPINIPVKITTPTPCYNIEVIKTVSDNFFDYNFVLSEEGEACIQMVKEHELSVVFDPSGAGTYTLRFLVDGNLKETREIIVTE